MLHLPETLAAAAERRRVSADALWAQVEPLRARLFAARAERRRPATDDKVLAEWNGMAIAGLATAGDLLGERWMIDRAASAADFVLAAMRPGGGPLLHTFRGGEAKIPAFLGDYAYVLRGLLALRRATVISQASGFCGIPLVDQSASAAANASDKASSAPATSRVRAARKAISLP